MKRSAQQPISLLRITLAAALSVSFVAGALWWNGQGASPLAFAATKAMRCEAYQTAIQKLQNLRILVENARTIEDLEIYGQVLLSIDKELQDKLEEGGDATSLLPTPSAVQKQGFLQWVAVVATKPEGIALLSFRGS